jgi:hypothetical protein
MDLKRIITENKIEIFNVIDTDESRPDKDVLFIIKYTVNVLVKYSQNIIDTKEFSDMQSKDVEGLFGDLHYMYCRLTTMGHPRALSCLFQDFIEMIEWEYQTYKSVEPKDYFEWNYNNYGSSFHYSLISKAYFLKGIRQMNNSKRTIHSFYKAVINDSSSELALSLFLNEVKQMNYSQELESLLISHLSLIQAEQNLFQRLLENDKFFNLNHFMDLFSVKLRNDLPQLCRNFWDLDVDSELEETEFQENYIDHNKLYMQAFENDSGALWNVD